MTKQTTVDLPSTIEKALEAYKSSGGPETWYFVSQEYIDKQLTELIKEIIGEKTPPTGFHKHVSPYDLYHNMYIDEALERARERGFDV